MTRHPGTTMRQLCLRAVLLAAAFATSGCGIALPAMLKMSESNTKRYREQTVEYRRQAADAERQVGPLQAQVRAAQAKADADAKLAKEEKELAGKIATLQRRVAETEQEIGRRERLAAEAARARREPSFAELGKHISDEAYARALEEARAYEALESRYAGQLQALSSHPKDSPARRRETELIRSQATLEVIADAVVAADLPRRILRDPAFADDPASHQAVVVLAGAERELLAALQDFMGGQVETSDSFGGLGIEVTVKDQVLTVVAPIKGTPADRAGIQPGDKILKIEGQPTKDMTLMDAVRKLQGPPGSKVTISMLREGAAQPTDVTLTREVIEVKRGQQKGPGDRVSSARVNSPGQPDGRRYAQVQYRLVGMRAAVTEAMAALVNRPDGGAGPSGDLAARLDTLSKVTEVAGTVAARMNTIMTSAASGAGLPPVGQRTGDDVLLPERLLQLIASHRDGQGPQSSAPRGAPSLGRMQRIAAMAAYSQAAAFDPETYLRMRLEEVRLLRGAVGEVLESYRRMRNGPDKADPLYDRRSLMATRFGSMQ